MAGRPTSPNSNVAVTSTPTARGADDPHCLHLTVTEPERLRDLDGMRADRGMMALVDAGDLDNAVRAAPPLRNEVACPHWTADEGSIYPIPASTYSAPGGLRQGPGGAAESLAEATTCGKGNSENARH